MTCSRSGVLLQVFNRRRRLSRDLRQENNLIYQRFDTVEICSCITPRPKIHSSRLSGFVSPIRRSCWFSRLVAFLFICFLNSTTAHTLQSILRPDTSEGVVWIIELLFWSLVYYNKFHLRVNLPQNSPNLGREWNGKSILNVFPVNFVQSKGQVSVRAQITLTITGPNSVDGKLDWNAFKGFEVEKVHKRRWPSQKCQWRTSSSKNWFRCSVWQIVQFAKFYIGKCISHTWDFSEGHNSQKCIERICFIKLEPMKWFQPTLVQLAQNFGLHGTLCSELQRLILDTQCQK